MHLVAKIQTQNGDQAGLRSGSQIAVRVEIAALYDAGIPIYVSKQGVYLVSEDIPPRFILDFQSVETCLKYKVDGEPTRRPKGAEFRG